MIKKCRRATSSSASAGVPVRGQFCGNREMEEIRSQNRDFHKNNYNYCLNKFRQTNQSSEIQLEKNSCFSNCISEKFCIFAKKFN